MIELIPMINEPDESGDGGKLVPIETDEEWDMIEEVVQIWKNKQSFVNNKSLINVLWLEILIFQT